MVQCIATRTNGDPCKAKSASGSTRCSRHQPKTEVSLQRTMASALRVAEKYETVYQDFRERKEPFDVREELAIFRTLQVEQRDIIENRRVARIDAAIEIIRNRLDSTIERDEDFESTVQELLTLVSQHMRYELLRSFGFAFRSLDDITEVSNLLDKTVKAAEKMKKIQEGTKLNIQIDTGIILTILNKCIFPVIRDPAMRQAIAQNLSSLGVMESLSPGSEVNMHGEVEQPVSADRTEEENRRKVAALLADISLTSGECGDVMPVEVPPWGN